MRSVAGLILLCILSIRACAAESTAAPPAVRKEQVVSLRLWASLEPEGEPLDRFLPGRKVFFNAQVTVEKTEPSRPIAVSLWLTGPEGWRADLLPRLQTTVAKLERALVRPCQWPEDLRPELCGGYEFSARVERERVPAAERSVGFRIEPPVALQQAWVDTMALALPRPASNRLYTGVPFYFHARHRFSDLLDMKEAQVTIEWRVRHAGQEMVEVSASATKTLSGDPEELVLTRKPSPLAPSARLLGVSVMECTAQLGRFRSRPVRTAFMVSRPPAGVAPGRAVVKLQSVSVSPKATHAGGEVVLVMKYRVSGLREGEVLAVIEQQMVTGAGQERLLPMRSAERGNGTYEARTHFPVPKDAKGRYLYEASVLGAGKKLCEGRAVFEVREVEIGLFDLSVWPKQLRAGEQVTVAFRFSVSGLGREESLGVERVVEVKGPWSARMTKKGTLSGAAGVSYRTRLDIVLPQDAPAGKYVVMATVVPERGAANKLEASFEVMPD